MIKANFSLQHFRHQLASYEALPQLVALGLLSGVGCGLLIALFRYAIDTPLAFLLPLHVENFEGLTSYERFILPIIGGLTLALMYKYWPLIKNKVGVVHLLERLAYHQGQIPGKNLITQFIVAVIALVSGQSVGREGPAIYLGASLSSILGQFLHIPDNSHRILIACGSAAAISAAFNTPLAGVVFAMEVILLDYTIAGFTPIIVASVTSALVTRLIFGDEPIFQAPAFEILNYSEIPWIIVLAVAIGCLATAFIKIMLFTREMVRISLSIKLAIAGLLTGAVALFYPQVMGTGYDTISDTFSGNLELSVLLAILIAKVILTPVILGLGIPAGLIGPSLFIGAVAGAALGITGNLLVDISVSHIGMYAMLGMGAMMAAVLNAPLAALIALLELTHNHNIIFPGMIAIVCANLTTRYLFNTPSAFLATLQAQGLDYRLEPMAQILTRVSVAKAMAKNLSIVENHISLTDAQKMNNQQTMWVVIRNNHKLTTLFPAVNLNNFLERDLVTAQELIDLDRIPAQRFTVHCINVRATLHEALQKMNNQDIDVLCVLDHKDQLLGVLSRTQIEHYYNTKQYQ
jgi:CIC family chloride channel protein